MIKLFERKIVNRLLSVSINFCFGCSKARLAIDRSICILTRAVVITGFNRSLLVDWWSIGRLKKTWLMCIYFALFIPCFTELYID